MVRAWSEPLVYRSPKLVVVPSNGLRRELEAEFPHLGDRVEVIANPIDTKRLVRPAGFDAGEVRRELGFDPDDLVLTFVALGHFERKGLPLVLDAMHKVGRSDLKLAVVGGRSETIASYRDKAAGLGLSGQVAFTGMRDDIRPWLWAADAFVFPSQYETFSLVSYEAAAAGLPIVVTKLHGVEDFARDRDTALVVGRSADEVASALRRLYAMGPEGRRHMGAKAAAAVSSFTTESFVASWRRVLNELEAGGREVQAVGSVAR
jgi:glycosyltransferase involved in cell wall biosynthesis